MWKGCLISDRWPECRDWLVYERELAPLRPHWGWKAGCQWERCDNCLITGMKVHTSTRSPGSSRNDALICSHEKGQKQGVKNEESSNPAYFLTPQSLAHHCLKWVWMADCQFWKTARNRFPSWRWKGVRAGHFINLLAAAKSCHWDSLVAQWSNVF